MELGKAIRAKEVADRLGVTVDAVYKQIANPNGVLRGVRCGSAVWVLEEDIEKYKPREYPRDPKGLFVACVPDGSYKYTLGGFFSLDEAIDALRTGKQGERKFELTEGMDNLPKMWNVYPTEKGIVLQEEGGHEQIISSEIISTDMLKKVIKEVISASE